MIIIPPLMLHSIALTCGYSDFVLWHGICFTNLVFGNKINFSDIILENKDCINILLRLVSWSNLLRQSVRYSVLANQYPELETNTMLFSMNIKQRYLYKLGIILNRLKIYFHGLIIHVYGLEIHCINKV